MTARPALLIALILLIASVPTAAFAWGTCKHRAPLAENAAVSGVKRVVIAAAAGDLKIEANANATQLQARGDACAPTAELLAAIKLNLRRQGDIQIDGVQGNVDVDRDSSGDIRVAHVGGSLRIGADSSGDIVANDVKGSFTVVEDGGGDIDYARIGGEVKIPEEKRK